MEYEDPCHVKEDVLRILEQVVSNTMGDVSPVHWLFTGLECVGLYTIWALTERLLINALEISYGF